MHFGNMEYIAVLKGLQYLIYNKFITFLMRYCQNKCGGLIRVVQYNILVDKCDRSAVVCNGSRQSRSV